MYGRLEAPGPPFAAAVAGVVDGASDPAVRDLVSADIFGRTRARGRGLISPLLLLPVQQCTVSQGFTTYKYNPANIM